MRIRTKLTLLLLLMTLVPLSLLTGLDTVILHRLGSDVADDMRDNLIDVSQDQLQASLAHYIDILRLEGQIAMLRGMHPGMPGGWQPMRQGETSAQPMPPIPQSGGQPPAFGQGHSMNGGEQGAFGQEPGGQLQDGPISVRVMKEMLERPNMRGMVTLIIASPPYGGPVINSEISKETDPRLWRPGVMRKPFPADDPDLVAMVEDAFSLGPGIGFFRAPFNGRPSLWGHSHLKEGERVFMIIPLDRVTAMSEVARANIMHATNLTLWNTGGLGAVALVMVGALSMIASRRVTLPLERLTGAAHRVSQGDFEARAGIKGDDELSNLGKTFDEMVPKLQEQMNMQQALELASEVQRRLLPVNTPVVDGLDIAGLSIPCDETGGDYIDYLETEALGPGRAAVVVGDVTGHGISAALLMATARGMMRGAGDVAGDLPARIRCVNDLLCADLGDTGQFMTLFAMELDRRDGTARYIRAGHDPALLYDPKTDEFHELEGHPGPLMGIMEGFGYELTEQTGLSRGQVLLVGTDGVWESFSPTKELYGKERLREVVRRYHDGSAQDILNAVFASVERFRGGTPAEDDTTLVVVKFTPRSVTEVAPEAVDRRAPDAVSGTA